VKVFKEQSINPMQMLTEHYYNQNYYNKDLIQANLNAQTAFNQQGQLGQETYKIFEQQILTSWVDWADYSRHKVKQCLMHKEKQID
jgi:hypothetical protein